MDQQIKELTLLLLYITSWEDMELKSLGEFRRSWKGYDFTILNELTDEDLIVGSKKAKSVYLTEDGIKKAKVLMKKHQMDDHPDLLDSINFDLFEVAQERFVVLEEVFPIYDEVSYVYDFGDHWEHSITLEKIIKSDVFEATYVNGDGERPPEDVGGSWGFEEYIRIIADENDSRHHDMKIWAEEQKDRRLTAKQINNKLDSVVRGYMYETFGI